jgi:dihydropyrimidinase
MSVMIKGGRIITASDDFVADLFIEHDRVTCIGDDLAYHADEVIDARGRYVMPGMVDPHAHFENPFHDTVSCDDFTDGTISAAFGGTTCALHFALQRPGWTLPETLEYWHERMALHPPVVDVGFHVGICDMTAPDAVTTLASLPEQGVTSFKMFMAYKDEGVGVDDETLFRVMQIAGQAGALVMVHAENGSVIEVLRQQAVERGQTEPRFHATTRPPETEAEAVNRAIVLAGLAAAPLYVVHVSCAEALAPIQAARGRGARVWGETCVQYLLTDERSLELPDFEGAKFIFTPPPRDAKNWEPLWRALATGALSTVGSDHSPHRFSDQLTMGATDFTKIPNGAPGIEDRLVMLHDAGVNTGRLTVRDLVRLLSTAPAKLFGLYPRKGSLGVGSDADVVVFDPAHEFEVSAQTHHSKTDYNLYEGTRVTGRPEVVLVRGAVVVREGELVAEPGYGAFVKRERFGASGADAGLSALAQLG